MATDRPGRPFKVFSDKLRPNKRPERGTTESRVSLIRLRTRTRDAREISYFHHCVFPTLLTTVPLPLFLVPLYSVSFSLFLRATYSQLQQPRYPIVLPTFVRSLDILSHDRFTGSSLPDVRTSRGIRELTGTIRSYRARARITSHALVVSTGISLRIYVKSLTPRSANSFAERKYHSYFLALLPLDRPR